MGYGGGRVAGPGAQDTVTAGARRTLTLMIFAHSPWNVALTLLDPIELNSSVRGVSIAWSVSTTWSRHICAQGERIARRAAM